MELVAACLVSVVVGAVVGAWVAWRGSRGQVAFSPENERRVLDHVERIRGAVATEVREGGQSLQKTVADSAADQTERLTTSLDTEDIPLRSYVLLYRWKTWWVKWRVTTPAPIDAARMKAIVELTETLLPPKSDSGSSGSGEGVR